MNTGVESDTSGAVAERPMETSIGTASQATCSIVIPAYNEEAVIGRCLSALLKDAAAGEFEIIVACNGCVDRTVEIARSYGPDVTVVETETRSKAAAMNLGNRTAKSLPRYFIDADMQLETASIRRLNQAFKETAALAISPRLRFDHSLSSWPVRAYYRTWMLQPYFQGGLGGGCYGVSAEGLKRLNEFPNLTADDEYVRRLFEPHERVRVKDVEVTVICPRHLDELVKIKTRSRRGNVELARSGRKKPESIMKQLTFPLRILARPWLWLDAFVYAYVVAATTVRAYQTARKGTNVVWERDESSRTGVQQ
jgi:glycosyltransferase involved in cell wall biosynthesis